jgi:hypothetical protein
MVVGRIDKAALVRWPWRGEPRRVVQRWASHGGDDELHCGLSCLTLVV